MKVPVMMRKGEIVYMSPPKKPRPVLFAILVVTIIVVIAIVAIAAILTIPLWSR